jgi:ribosome maturation factor RimP
MTIIEEISAAITASVEATGNVLEEVTLTPEGSSKILTIIVDNENHLNLDQITVVTKAISEILDTLEVLGETPFTLEVTTPGLDRPLTVPRHWKKNSDRLVSVSLKDGTKILGRIGALTDTGVMVDDSSIDFADIERAMIEVEFKKVGA